MSKREVYFSTDIETDGPIPGINSMLSFGVAAFSESGEIIGTYSANLDLLEGAAPDPDTMKWWSTQGEAWDACRLNTRPAAEVMPEFVAWVESLRNAGSPVFVGYPAGFDFLFMYWYLVRFAKSPFSFSALDIKTYAMAVLGCGYREASKKNMPKRWFSKRPHTHVALDDALEQGDLFMNILAERKKQLHGR